MKMFLYYAFKNNNQQHIVDLVKVILEKLNPDWSDRQFNYDSQSKTLRLSGRNFSSFSAWRTPLHALDIEHLYLQGAQIYELKFLESLIVKTLDISKTSVSLKKLRRHDFFKLKLLLVNKYQLSQLSPGDFPEDLEIKLVH